MDRRKFLTASSTALASGSVLSVAGSVAGSGAAQAQANNELTPQEPPLAPQVYYPQQEQFRIGYTTNTQGGWEGDPFIGMSEAREVGFRYVEIFGTTISAPPASAPGRRGGAGRAARVYKVWPDGYVYKPSTAPRQPREIYYPDRWEALQHRIYEIGVQLVCINTGVAGEPDNFADPAIREAVVNNFVDTARFSRRFGCDHQKANTGTRPKGPDGKGVPEMSLEDMKNVVLTLAQIGKRCTDELGIKFGVHAHLSGQLATEREIDYVMENTNPDHVHFVLDTSMVNMAGIDPVALTKKLAKRICEFHFKDNAKNTRGGAKPALVDMPDDYFNNPISYPLGEGGVDFPAIVAYLRTIGWRGHLNVELETSPWRTPKASAAISAKYIRNVLKIDF